MKRRHLASRLGLFLLLALAGGRFVPAEEPAKPAESRPKYVRLERNEADEPLALQTAIVRFASTDPERPGVVVDLVGAIHVGEKAYYEELNKRFEDYDVVLFELVAPEGTKVPRGGRSSGHPVAMMQNGLKDMLELEHQLAYIDYTKDNMVHADMSPDEFAKSMSERNESFAAMFFRMMGQAMAQQALQKPKSRTTDVDFFAALFDRDRAGSLKRTMAEQFESMDGAMLALEGPTGSTIITERNKVALKKLAEQIAAGKKKIAVFYGAGHMNDIEKRLLADFQLKRDSEQWLTAWDLTKAKESNPSAKKPAASTRGPASEPQAATRN